MDIRPLRDRIIVHRLDEGEQQVGGIIIPDTAKEKPQQGTGIAAGNGKVNEDGTRGQIRSELAEFPFDERSRELQLMAIAYDLERHLFNS